MAVRIYTLAKDLKIDSKELVELCTRAGIQDKGSALASMTDEEVAKLKEFIAAKSRPAERPAPPPPRPAAPPAPGKPAAPTHDHMSLTRARLKEKVLKCVPMASTAD